MWLILVKQHVIVDIIVPWQCVIVLVDVISHFLIKRGCGFLYVRLERLSPVALRRTTVHLR